MDEENIYNQLEDNNDELLDEMGELPLINEDHENDSSGSDDLEYHEAIGVIDDGGEETNAQDDSVHEEPSLSLADINFDLSLPGTHSYLGRDLEDLAGRTLMDSDSVIDLSVFVKSGVILLPGQTLPIIIYYPWEADMLLNAKATNKTVGFLCTTEVASNLESLVGSIGTTGELVSMREDDVEGGGFSILHAVIIGRQRFRILEIHRHMNSVHKGKVKILDEASEFGPEHPLCSLVPNTWQNLCVQPHKTAVELPRDPHEIPQCRPVSAVMSSFDVCPKSVWGTADTSRPGPFQEVATPAVDRFGKPFLYKIRSNEYLPRVMRAPEIYLAVNSAMTSIPYWVVKQYELNLLMDNIRQELKQWNDTWNLSHWTTDLAVQFSYWLIQNLPVPDRLKIFLLELDHVVQRLRACLDILRKCSNFVCRDCGEPVTMKRDIVCLAKEGSLQAFVNPGGHIHEMLTVGRVNNISLTGRPSAEHSWFPGYAWTIMQCRSCSLHMGWRFTATKKDLKPSQFWGVCRVSVVPNFETDSTWLPNT